MRAGGRPAGALCLAMLPWHASAAAEAEPGRGNVEAVIEELFLGEAVYPQDALELQITGGLGASRAGDRTAAVAALELELGLTDRLQIAAEAPLVLVSTSTPASAERQVGLGNAALELMYNPLSSRARGLALSAGLELAFPAASDAGEDAWGVEAFAVTYKVLGRIHANLAAAVELELPTGAGAEHELSSTVALGVFAPIGRWVPVLELRVAPSEVPAAVLSAGTIWRPGGELELGAAVQLGLDARSLGGLLTATLELELAGD